MRTHTHTTRFAAPLAALFAAALLNCGPRDSPTEPVPLLEDPVAVAPDIGVIALDPDGMVLKVGSAVDVEATVWDRLGTELRGTALAWSTGDDAVLAVDERGTVTAVGPGATELRVEAGGEVGLAYVTVAAADAGFTMTAACVQIYAGETVDLAEFLVVTSTDLVDEEVTWYSERPEVASVDADGIATGLWGGHYAYVRATIGDQTVKIRVHVLAPAFRVKLEPIMLHLRPSQRGRFIFTVWDEFGAMVRGRPVEWTSSDPKVVRIVSDGLVEAVSEGTAFVRADCEGKSMQARVLVLNVVNGIAVKPAVADLRVGRTVQLSATYMDHNGNPTSGGPIVWSSSNDGVATVDANTGLVTGVSLGEAIISAAGDNMVGTARIIVGPAPGPPDVDYGNNMSWPVVFAEGVGMTGAWIESDPGVRPRPEEGLTVESVPFFEATNVPDFLVGDKEYFKQQTSNAWCAKHLDGDQMPMVSTAVEWGKALTHERFNVRSTIPIVTTLYWNTAEKLPGYEMIRVGRGMYATSGELESVTPTVFTAVAKLKIEKLSDTHDPVALVYEGRVGDAMEPDLDEFHAEVNMVGKLGYRFDAHLRNADLPENVSRIGWWRITFELMEDANLDALSVRRNTSIDAKMVDAGALYMPKVSDDGRRTWVDIYVRSPEG